MAIVDPDLEDCIAEYHNSGTRYDFVKQHWIGQVTSLPDINGSLDIICFKLTDEDKCVVNKIDGRP
jgi:hypothetical protein